MVLAIALACYRLIGSRPLEAISGKPGTSGNLRQTKAKLKKHGNNLETNFEIFVANPKNP